MKIIFYISSYLLHPLVYVDDGRDDVGGDSVHVAVQHRAPGIPPYAVVVSALAYSHIYDHSMILHHTTSFIPDQASAKGSNALNIWTMAGLSASPRVSRKELFSFTSWHSSNSGLSRKVYNYF